MIFKFDTTSMTSMYTAYWGEKYPVRPGAEATDEWFKYALETWGIMPDGRGTGWWKVVDEDKYAMMLLRWT